MLGAAPRASNHDWFEPFGHALERGLLSATEIGAIRERVKGDLETAVAFAEQSPFPDPKDLLVDMFAD